MSNYWYIFAVFILVSLTHPPVSEAWSGNVCGRQESYYYKVRECVYRYWGSCCQWRTTWKCGYRWVSFCCTGWEDTNNNRNCIIPICSPRCYNGGTCIRPNRCRCLSGYSGDLCDNPLCSWERPCYPGACAYGTDTCKCISKYGGKFCDTLEAGEDPQLTSASAVMLQIDRENNFVLYSLTTDATNSSLTKPETFWTNLDFFNNLQINWESYHENRTDLPPLPSYITEAKFGIVNAYAQLVHKKLENGKWVEALNKNYNCSEGTMESPAEGIVNCTLPVTDFFNSVEHRDKLNITVHTENGGYRVLNQPNVNPKPKEQYKGRRQEKTMHFEFDFEQPFHCKVESGCPSLPVRVDGDEIRRTGFTMSWKGWSDELSGVWRYVWRIFKMKKSSNGNLTEILKPVYWSQVNGTGAGDATDKYTPVTAGMYSVYLQVADKANNSQFARTLVLYDPDSTVEIDVSPTSPLYVRSGSKQTGYKWQQNLTNPIRVAWSKHFRNKFHDENGLLNSVNRFPVKDHTATRGFRSHVSHKAVLDSYDDNAGSRRLDGIPNSRGIVKFEMVYKSDSRLGESCSVDSPQGNWQNTSDPEREEFSFTPQRQKGTTICVWIRATDVLGSSKTDMTMVHFDDTKPEAKANALERNVGPEVPDASTVPYHSRMSAAVRDQDSGVSKITWKIAALLTGQMFAEGVVDTRIPPEESCTPLSGTCDCAPANTRNCYRRNVHFYIPHCAINVSKIEVQSLVVSLDITVVNGAGLETTIPSILIRNIPGLAGINTYVAPMNYRKKDVGTKAVTIVWDNPPSCYTLSAIRIAYRPTEGGSVVNKTVYSVNTEISLNGLHRGTDYVMWIYNIYDTEISNPSEFAFTTKAIAGGEIAGLVIGLLLLIIIATLLIIMFVLWRRGTLKTTIERRMTRARTVLMRNRVKTNSHAYRKTFLNNLAHTDDLYVYGNLSFDNNQSWFLEGADLDLQKLIAEGRFARVYKAVLNGNQTVAAKMLLPTTNQSDTEQMVMKAKINFMASNEFIHPNVIQFIGAIKDDVERGPIMLLEHCEMGTLKKWLTEQKQLGRIPEDIIDRLFHITFGVCKGMEYLASKDVVHRKLAARNVLLDFTLQPKIIGFGPVPDELVDETDNSTKGERLPLRWMAVDLVTNRSTKKSTEKSDVWSFGIVTWEIFSLGDVPFSNIKGSELGKKLKQGIRLKRPELMPDDYDRMTQRCWNQMPEDRPSFGELVKEQSLLFDDSGRSTSYYDSTALSKYQEY